MLDSFPINAVLPAADLDRARAWYADKLGLKPTSEDMGGLWYETGGTAFVVTHSQFSGTAPNTAAEWRVTDLLGLMAKLRARGVVFEEYDIPDFKTENGLFAYGGFRAAWFKDSEGNTLGLGERP